MTRPALIQPPRHLVMDLVSAYISTSWVELPAGFLLGKTLCAGLLGIFQNGPSSAAETLVGSVSVFGQIFCQPFAIGLVRKLLDCAKSESFSAVPARHGIGSAILPIALQARACFARLPVNCQYWPICR